MGSPRGPPVGPWRLPVATGGWLGAPRALGGSRRARTATATRPRGSVAPGGCPGTARSSRGCPRGRPCRGLLGAAVGLPRLGEVWRWPGERSRGCGGVLNPTSGSAPRGDTGTRGGPRPAGTCWRTGTLGCQHSHACTHTQEHAPTRAHVCAGTPTRANTGTHTRAHTPMHAHPESTRVSTWRRTRVLASTHTGARMHARARMHTTVHPHAPRHTHSHTHTPAHPWVPSAACAHAPADPCRRTHAHPQALAHACTALPKVAC